MLTELYSCDQAAQRAIQFGTGNKFVTAMIVNGKVFVERQMAWQYSSCCLDGDAGITKYGSLEHQMVNSLEFYSTFCREVERAASDANPLPKPTQLFLVEFQKR